LQQENAGLIFANLVDFDALYGHRNNPRGYANALEAFDRRLPEISAAMRNSDVTLITADHGNDPTTPSTDHSRERVPLLLYGQAIRPNHNLGTRGSFADVSATIAALLGLPWAGAGQSFAPEILR
jgi:phosphopentomutase